jgi:hypothetical protein
VAEAPPEAGTAEAGGSTAGESTDTGANFACGWKSGEGASAAPDGASESTAAGCTGQDWGKAETGERGVLHTRAGVRLGAATLASNTDRDDGCRPAIFFSGVSDGSTGACNGMAASSEVTGFARFECPKTSVSCVSGSFSAAGQGWAVGA